jgi:hypothetical protein
MSRPTQDFTDFSSHIFQLDLYNDLIYINGQMEEVGTIEPQLHHSPCHA